MLTPKELDDLPQSLIEIYSKAELDILTDMCRRISNYDFFIPAAEFQYKKMIEMGNIHDDILKAMSEMSGISKEHIIALMDEAGVKAITFDDRIYKKAGLNPVPISNSRALQDVLKEGIKKTLGEFTNLTQTTAKATTRQIEIALDNAYMQITTGAFDSNTAIRNAVKYLSGNGIATATFEYNNSFNYLESAVRRAVLTGINQTCCKLQTTRADEMECDLVEVTAHAGARTGEGVNNHSNWQGKVYSRSGKSNKYPDFISSTGYGTVTGLAGVNCRHSFYPFFENISKRAYTDEQLKEYKGKKYTYNGKELTEYEATQLQRKFERNIRKYKREINSLNSINYDCKFEKNKLAKWQEKQTDFISQTGLKRHKYRERVFTTKKDYDNIKTKGALNSFSKEASNHAELYYKSVRKMKTDTVNISNNIGWKKESIDKIKEHVFIKEHELISGKRRFDPSYDMAVSWQRLIEGKYIKKQDLVLLKHEYLELTLMKKGYSQNEAHKIASKKHDFAKMVMED